MAAEPTREEVVAWLARTGRPPAEAVSHFWPGVDDPDRRELLGGRVRKWAHRARHATPAPTDRAPAPAPPKHPSPPPPGSDLDLEALLEESGPKVPRPEARPERAAQDRVAWLETELVELDRDVEWARAQGKLALVPKLHAQLLTVRDELDQARADRQKIRSIDRTPAAVAEAVAKRSELLERLRARRLQEQDPRTRDL